MTRFFCTIVLIVITALAVFSQTTEFTYQGSLKDGASSANANYDFEFALFDAVSGGNQIGATIPRNNMSITNGIFTVKLDFGSSFPGVDRYLHIRVRLVGQPTFTTLSPRQMVNSAPYSVKSLNTDNAATATNATQLGGVAANQYVVTTDPRMADDRNPSPNSANYVQNRTTAQAASNFNISGTGTANLFSAGTQYNIGAQRMLSAPGAFNTFVGRLAGRDNSGGNNVFVGDSSGIANTTGSSNAFFGYNAGQQSTTGSNNAFFGDSAGFSNGADSSNNSFFGKSAGSSNVASDNSFFGALAGANNFSGTQNSFFGKEAGTANGDGFSNSFFGYQAGLTNTQGAGNSFFGRLAGYSNQAGYDNSFFGQNSGVNNTANDNAFFGAVAGFANSSGEKNSFFGRSAGRYNLTGNSNTFIGVDTGYSQTSGCGITLIGTNADVGADSLSNATAIGYNAVVSQSNSLVLGNFGGLFGGFFDTKVGIGTSAPNFRLHVVDSQNFGIRVQTNVLGGTVASFGGNGSFQVDAPGIVAGRFVITEAGNVGINTNNPLNKLDVAGIIAVGSLGAAGSTSLCRNSSNQISTCSSSLRYKTNIGQFASGLAFVNKLRPISFDWKDGMKDVGFGAEDIVKIDPRFVTYSSTGEVEGVKYDRLSVVFVNAVKEQQSQIEVLEKQTQSQQKQIEALTQALCSLKPDLEVCK